MSQITYTPSYYTSNYSNRTSQFIPDERIADYLAKRGDIWTEPRVQYFLRYGDLPENRPVFKSFTNNQTEEEIPNLNWDSFANAFWEKITGIRIVDIKFHPHIAEDPQDYRKLSLFRCVVAYKFVDQNKNLDQWVTIRDFDYRKKILNWGYSSIDGDVVSYNNTKRDQVLVCNYKNVNVFSYFDLGVLRYLNPIYLKEIDSTRLTDKRKTIALGTINEITTPDADLPDRQALYPWSVAKSGELLSALYYARFGLSMMSLEVTYPDIEGKQNGDSLPLKVTADEKSIAHLTNPEWIEEDGKIVGVRNREQELPLVYIDAKNELLNPVIYQYGIKKIGDKLDVTFSGMVKSLLKGSLQVAKDRAKFQRGVLERHDVDKEYKLMSEEFWDNEKANWDTHITDLEALVTGFENGNYTGRIEGSIGGMRLLKELPFPCLLPYPDRVGVSDIANSVWIIPSSTTLATPSFLELNITKLEVPEDSSLSFFNEISEDNPIKAYYPVYTLDDHFRRAMWYDVHDVVSCWLNNGRSIYHGDSLLQQERKINGYGYDNYFTVEGTNIGVEAFYREYKKPINERSKLSIIAQTQEWDKYGTDHGRTATGSILFDKPDISPTKVLVLETLIKEAANETEEANGYLKLREWLCGVLNGNNHARYNGLEESNPGYYQISGREGSFQPDDFTVERISITGNRYTFKFNVKSSLKFIWGSSTIEFFHWIKPYVSPSEKDTTDDVIFSVLGPISLEDRVLRNSGE